MAKQKYSQEKLRVLERRRRAVLLKKGGLTLEGIASAIRKEFPEETKYNISQAFKDVQFYYQQLESECMADVAMLRQMSSERLETAMFALFPKVQKGDYNAIDRWIKLCSEFSKLWGLHLPPAERPMNQETATSIELELITGESPE